MLLTLPFVALGPAFAADPAPPSRTARDVVAASLTHEQRAELAFLEHLGWRLVWDSSTREVKVHGGTPNQRADLTAAHEAGDLRILVPPGVTPGTVRAFGSRLPALSDSLPSRYAYQHRIRVAVRRATAKLQANTEAENYVFPQLLVMNSPFWRVNLPEPEWEKIDKVWYARSSVSRAIEAMYTREAEAECFTGQLIAQWATQYELYGSKGFEAAFRPHDIRIGKPEKVNDGPFGSTSGKPIRWRGFAMFIAKEELELDSGTLLAAHGPVAFCGLVGILLDADAQVGTGANENYTLVSVSPQATASLLANGGFAYINKRTKQALALLDSQKHMLHTAARLEAVEKQIEAILAEPVFTEIRVYIHPYGVVPLREIIEKKLRNAEVALEFTLYRCGQEYIWFRHYRDMFLKQRGVAPPAVPSGN